MAAMLGLIASVAAAAPQCSSVPNTILGFGHNFGNQCEALE